jgi:glutamate-1-semialdehyde 2,1-aminomutase
MFTIFFSENKIRNFEDVKSCDTKRFGLFFRKMLEEGIYFSPSQFEANFISIKHSKNELDKVLESVKKVLIKI